MHDPAAAGTVYPALLCDPPPAGIWNSQLTTMLGHCAAEITMNDARDFMVTAINPFGLWYYLIPCHSTPMKHADHHMYPRQVELWSCS
jgi:hypothetical protein